MKAARLCVATIVGARPQLVKAAAVSRALRRVEEVREVLVHTGQHYDQNMSDVFFAELDIPAPDHALGVGSGNHGAQTGRMLERLEPILMDVRPDWVLVYGDTNSTLAGALAATKLHLPVAHVEAGLRSFNRAMPEEINRIVTDHVADLLFAPTETAVANLRAEGRPSAAIHCVGDVMYDVARFYGARVEADTGLLDRLGLSGAPYVLATVHRAENTDDPKRLHAIVEGLATVARELPVVFPMHPRTRKALAAAGVSAAHLGQLRIVDPLGYLDMVRLERHAALIATDSGGVQKEAFFHGVPCVTLRDETEWVELVTLGWNVVVPPTSRETVANAIRERIGVRGQAAHPYGRGDSSAAIVARLVQGR